MANIVRIRRRASGSPGSPSELENAELAFNEVDDILYYGKGTGGVGGSATVIEAIGGSGAMVTLASTQTITGAKTFSNNVSLDSFRITDLDTPVNDTDAANKAYVDAARAGLDVKGSVIAATTSEITLSGEQTIDDVLVVSGNRVLVKNQSNPALNGIYLASTTGWTRTEDANSTETITPGLFTFVEQGTINENSGWVLTTDSAVTVGATELDFAQFSGAGMITAGGGMTKDGNTLNVETADVSRIVINADSIDLATTAVSSGTYKSVTVDDYGRITAGSNPTTLAGYGITDAQGLDDTLTALANTVVDADELIYATGVDTFSTSSLTAYARTLLDDADAAAARSTLELGSIATQDSNSVSITGGELDGVTLDNVTVDGGTF